MNIHQHPQALPLVGIELCEYVYTENNRQT